MSTAFILTRYSTDNQNPDTRGFFWGDKDNAFYSQYMSSLWTQMGGKASQWIPGVNPFVEETFDGSLPAFLAAFTSRKKLSKKEIDELQDLIDKMRG